MARPQKERVICSMPRYRYFSATGAEETEPICLTIDEYEALRLHDLEHLTQTAIAMQMIVSRPTVARLLNTAHEKVADAMVNGKPLLIRGGCCCVCEIGKNCPRAQGDGCPKKHCCAASCRHREKNLCKN